MKTLMLTLSLMLGFIMARGQKTMSEDNFRLGLETNTSYNSITRQSPNIYRAKMDVSGKHPTEGGYDQLYTITVVFQNHGAYYEYVAVLPSLDKALFDQLTGPGSAFSKRLQKDKKKFDEISFTKGENSNPIIYMKKTHKSTGAIPLVGIVQKNWLTTQGAWAFAADEQYRLLNAK